MNIVITRTRTKGEYTEGQLSIDGLRICSTLENAHALVPSGTYPLTLIKCKQYSRKMPCLTDSLKSSKSLNSSKGENPSNLSNPQTPQTSQTLQTPQTPQTPQTCVNCPKLPFVCTNSTLPCYCPMLKPGNGIHNRLDGSILVGQYNCLGSLIHPKTTFDPLYERIRKAISRGTVVSLIIKDG